MHGSTASQRPRQRISTSCTECRRRKQKCNQAKDRPCNNCARRYPPVVCSYDSGTSSRGSTVERVVDFQSEEQLRDEETPTSGTDENPAYAGTGYATASHLSSGYPTVSEEQSYSGTYYPPAQSSSSHWPQQDQSWNTSYAPPASSTYDSSYYASTPEPVAGQTYDATYYPNTYAGYTPQGGWLSTNGDPRAFVGTGTTYDALNDLPSDPSRRNAELYHFFLQSLAPYLVTIDGNDPPSFFYKEWTPWMVQSPLLSGLTLLSSSCYLSDARGLESGKSSETMTIKSRVISTINNYLKKKRMKDVEIDALAAVMYLAFSEWYWGDTGSFWAHLKGLKEMLRLRGGLDSLSPNSHLRKQLILADYQIACAFEQDIFLHSDPYLVAPLPPLASYPAHLESPLLSTNIRVQDIYPTLSLTPTIASILDDIKFLTSSIRTFQSQVTPPSATDLATFKINALFVDNRISSLLFPTPSSDLPSENDLIYTIIHTTALIYIYSIVSLSPFSASASTSTSITSEQMATLYSQIWKVSLTRWKQMPGIFLWVLLVVATSTASATGKVGKERRERKEAIKMLNCVILYIGQESQEAVISMMRSFLGVQKWIGGRDGRAFEGLERGKGKEVALARTSFVEEGSRIVEEEQEQSRIMEILGGAGISSREE